MINQKTLEYFFDNAEDGEKVGFYLSAPLGRLIRWFQKKDKTANLDNVCHVGTIYEVTRDSNGGEKTILSFMLSHQTGSHGSCYDNWIIEREGNNIQGLKYTIKTKTKYTDFYYLKLKNRFTMEQVLAGINDALEYKKYGHFSFIAYIPSINNFVAKVFNVKLFENINRVCSKHIAIQDAKAGRNLKNFMLQYPFPTPENILTYNKEDLEGELCQIVDFNECKL